MTESQFFKSCHTDSVIVFTIYGFLLASGKTPYDLAVFLGISIDESLSLCQEIVRSGLIVKKLADLNICESC